MIQKLLLAICLIFFSTYCVAKEKSNLYRITVPLESQSQEKKISAFRQGLQDILVKLSGKQSITDQKLIRDILKRPQDFVDEFTYESSDDPAYPYELKILFNKDDIQHILEKAHIPFWSEGLPTTIIWLSVTDRSHSNEILGNETPDLYANLLREASKQYGLPILLPMMDMVDMEKVSPPDVNALDLAKIKIASTRYSPDAILIGNVSQHHDEYQSSWQLVLSDVHWEWNLTEDSMEKMFAAIFQQVSSTLSQYYLQKSQDNKQYMLTLQIENIVERNDLSGVIKFLKTLPMVRQVQLSQITGDVVELAVLIQGDIAQFKTLTEREHRLKIRSLDDAQQKFVYEWAH